MKRNYNLLLLSVVFAFGACSFAPKVDNDPDKDKLLIQIITIAMDQLHFEPKAINDDLSEEIYADYIEVLDPFKRFFTKQDISKFEKHKFKIDDQLKSSEIDFFTDVYTTLMQRKEEVRVFYKDILSKPFDFKGEEVYNSDIENLPFVDGKNELKKRWESQLKMNTLINFYDLVDEQKDLKEGKSSDAELEKKAREETMNSMDVFFTDYLDDQERKDWFATYINTIVEEYDPHTSYLAPVEKERFDQSMSGKLEGIGARLQKRLNYIKIVELISGGPAWRGQELEVGDVILKVRQENEDQPVSIVGMRINDAIKLIKGPKGTKVILTIKKDDGTIEDISITRDLVELEETYVKSSVVKKEGDLFGVINLPRFYINFEDYDERNAASDMKKEIERLKDKGVEGLVIDLRNNGGGSLKTVIDIAGFFIEKGPVVQVRSTGEAKEVLSDSDSSIVWDGPLVIMVNELSASASEILAAAMQDYKRAVIIGSVQTYGKGTVQNVLPLNRMVRSSTHGDLGALKLTRQKFYRINGGSTQLEGVKSDVVVPDRYSYIDIGERDLEDPLAWDKISPADYKVWNGHFNYKRTIERSKKRMENNAQLRLIDKNAKWAKAKSDENKFVLNYEAYKSRIELNEEEAKQFEPINDFETNSEFKSLPYEMNLFKKDTVLKEKRDRWHRALKKDVYIDEALHVLSDMSSSYRIKKIKN